MTPLDRCLREAGHRLFQRDRSTNIFRRSGTPVAFDQSAAELKEEEKVAGDELEKKMWIRSCSLIYMEQVGLSSREACCRVSSAGRRIPCFFILAISVVRFIPNRAAAPYGPPTNHPVASSAPTIRMRSDSFSVVLGGNAATDGERVGRRRFGSNPSFDSITARSITF